MRATEFIIETAMMGKIADSGKIIRILKKAHTVPFSDEKNWLLVDTDPGKGNSGLGIKWIPADTRFEWVRPYKDTVDENLTPQTIHKLADRKGVKWDNQPSFLQLTKRLTGKEHLDDLDHSGLNKVKRHLDGLQGVAEEVNSEILSTKNSLPTEKISMGDYEFNAQIYTGELGNPGLQIRAYDPKLRQGIQQIGNADFVVHTDEKGNTWLESDDTAVRPSYYGKGVAAMMYAFAKSLGNDIKPSPYQEPPGKKMWKKWGKDAKNLVGEQGVAEGLEQQYLWHGSRQKIPMLEPRQSVDTGGAAGSNQNAIYATSDPIFATQMGMPAAGSDYGHFPNDPQMVLFSGKIRKGENVYLHKLPMNGPDGKPQFVQGGNDREFHSIPGVKAIKPVEIKAVPVDRYLNLIRPATPQDLELRKKYMKQGVAESATVTRIDSKPITNFGSNLKAYKHTDDWSQSGVDTGDDSYWKNKNLKTNTTKGLFAGDPRRTALYATGNAYETRYVEFTQDGQPIVYFDRKDLPAMRSRKTYLTVFDASDFRQLPTGEWFSENPRKPIKQVPIGDPFKYIADQGWIVRVTDDLDKVFKQVQKMHKAGKIAHYGAEGMNESTQGVVEGLDEAVGGNYLYHSTQDANTAKQILSSGYILGNTGGKQPASDAQTTLPTVSFGRSIGYQTTGANVDRDYQVVFVFDRTSIETRYKTLGTSQSQTVRGLANPIDTEWGRKVAKLGKVWGLDANADGKVDYKEIGNASKSTASNTVKQAVSTHLNAPKAGGEFEEIVPTKTGKIPLQGLLVGFYLVPGKAASKDPELLNDPRRLDMPRPNQFVKATQAQGVAEGIAETLQQQQVRAAITKGMEKWDQNGIATYQSRPAKRHYFASSDWASGQLKGINSIDPDGTVVIELNDTTTAGLVKKLAALGGIPGVKTRQLKMTFDPAKANADGVTRGDVAEGVDPDKKYTIKKSYTMTNAGVEKAVWYIMDGDFVVDATDLRRDAKYYADKWNAAEKDSKNIAQKPTLEENLNVDVPNEEWLQNAIDYAIQKSPDRNGLPYMGKTTATARPVEVSVSILKRIPGMRREQSNVRHRDLAAIRKIMHTTGKLPLHAHTQEEYKPFINVAYDGSAWVNEGNHRIMAAAELGWPSLPVEISYFDGGERVESGAMYPGKIGLA